MSKSVLKSIFKKQMIITLLMGFASGLPLLLTFRTLQAWMTEAGVDLKTVGIFALASLPSTLKFVWAPFLDRFQILGFGRRKGWLLLAQIGLVLSLCAMAITDPKEQTYQMALIALFVSFFSSSQDIVVDAYRRETLSDEELGLGSTLYIYGYRIAMWVSGGLALILAQYLGWQAVYFLMAAIMAVCISATLWSPEPTTDIELPKSLKETIIQPFFEFLRRNGAWIILLFILLYKIGDNMAGNMLTPFYLKMGYSKEEIGWIAKTLSLPFTLVGGFIGGYVVLRTGILKSLFVFGIFQAASTLFFTLLTKVGHDLWALGAVICFEDISSSMGSAAFVAFMASVTNKKFTATQYALLSSLMRVPQTFIAAPSGFIVEALGWNLFFTVCALIAIPGLLMIYLLKRFTTSTP